MKKMSVLIPTIGRIGALIATLSSLSNQTYKDFDLFISDQSEEDDILDNGTLRSIFRFLNTQGIFVHIVKNLPKKGMAQQRQYLLDKSESKFSLFLDDDLLIEPFVLQNMVSVLEKEECGFVGCAPIGLSFSQDFRPEEETINFWKKKVKPEKISPKGKRWKRYKVHNAANIYHIEQKMKLKPSKPMRYKIAWVGACVLYDTKKLNDVGGFNFWKELPAIHCGEDVLAQVRVMGKYGGCGILPSGVYHQELPTTVIERNINAPEYIH